MWPLQQKLDDNNVTLNIIKRVYKQKQSFQIKYRYTQKQKLKVVHC